MDDRDSIPPLVAPGVPLSPESRDRNSRTLMLPGFGQLGQQRLAAARVLVIGAGGLGSAVLPGLAATGIGTIGIIDDDIVETSNLPRQTVHLPADVGGSKVASAAATIAALNPDTTVITFDVRLSAANALAILADFDLVIDGSDNFPTRYLSNDAAALRGIPVVWGAVHQFGGQAGVSWAANAPQYRDLFPEPPAPGEVPSCAEAGVLPSVCSVIGGILVSETIKLLTGVGEPLLGRVTTYDSLRGTFREVSYAADPLAAPITELIDYDLFCGIAAAPDALSALFATELQERLTRGDAITLIDVREPWEAQLAIIDGAALIPLGELEQDLTDDPDGVVTALRDTTLVVYCHHGPRAERAQQLLVDAGLPNTLRLTGGIDVWARDIDRALSRY
ncbi:ThiF family adenylyltransferase [Leifsonia sp. A12D58]|uniref:ThiF family adenylyltransferase n=1 Tax=Leifsonia sp. A12D58 TaxID=3397674 RepID=UPI0039E0A9F7